MPESIERQREAIAEHFRVVRILTPELARVIAQANQQQLDEFSAAIARALRQETTDR